MHIIYYGTTNTAKINHMKSITSNLPLNIIGINDYGSIDHNIIENGKEPLENAKMKALHYYKQIIKPVFSADSGLFFENIEYKEQPGINIRRINGKRLNDKEMINYYSKLAKRYGGELIGYYKNGIYVIIDEEKVLDKEIISEKFIITAKPHQKIIEGFPLDSLSVDIKTGKYYYDIEKTKYENESLKEFQDLFNEVIDRMERKIKMSENDNI